MSSLIVSSRFVTPEILNSATHNHEICRRSTGQHWRNKSLVICRFARAASLLALALAVVSFAPAQTFESLHTFSGGADGGYAFAPLIIDSSRNLYGTTYQGGDYNCDPSNPGRGCGVVYRMDTSGNETVLYSFRPLPDAEFPRSGVVQDSSGNLYGTTMWGGSSNLGTVYEISASGKQTVLHSFAHGTGGYHPQSGVIRDAAGNLYGTTLYGGNNSCVLQRTEYGCGVVYKISQGKEIVLHRFNGTDGGWPVADLLLDSQGNLYGTASAGSTNAGTLFKISKGGTFSVLHVFTDGNDGGKPAGALIKDSVGNLYGTTYYGGKSGRGTVFKVNTSGKETVLYNFTLGSDGGYPDAGVILDSAGNLYGTTYLGGDMTCSCGTIFKIDTSGHETVLHKFQGRPGEFPTARLVKDAAGNFYGTTAGDDLANYGSVFKLIP